MSIESVSYSPVKSLQATKTKTELTDKPPPGFTFFFGSKTSSSTPAFTPDSLDKGPQVPDEKDETISPTGQNHSFSAARLSGSEDTARSTGAMWTSDPENVVAPSTIKSKPAAQEAVREKPKSGIFSDEGYSSSRILFGNNNKSLVVSNKPAEKASSTVKSISEDTSSDTFGIFSSDKNGFATQTFNVNASSPANNSLSNSMANLSIATAPGGKTNNAASSFSFPFASAAGSSSTIRFGASETSTASPGGFVEKEIDVPTNYAAKRVKTTSITANSIRGNSKKAHSTTTNGLFDSNDKRAYAAIGISGSHHQSVSGKATSTVPIERKTKSTAVTKTITATSTTTTTSNGSSRSDVTRAIVKLTSGNDDALPPSVSEEDRDSEVAHLELLGHRPGAERLDEVKTCPIFTEPVRIYARSVSVDGVASGAEPPFSQYGLLAGMVEDDSHPEEAIMATAGSEEANAANIDRRIFYNVAAPSSIFICGSQGSGKSHTLSCLLENCLLPSRANRLPKPLTGIVFHYDTFTSDVGGAPCEAAYLSSSKGIDVRVLCSPANIRTIGNMYAGLPNVKVEALRFSQSDLNTQRLLDLMAVNANSEPLYIHVVKRVLRQLRVEQQTTGSPFHYGLFRAMLDQEKLTDVQMAPLRQRLDTLESFMHPEEAGAFQKYRNQTIRSDDILVQMRKLVKGSRTLRNGTKWDPKPGQLTIVDLSCPCITAEMACSLFSMCLSVFLEQSNAIGRVVALDEAHKFMTGSAECQALTESLLSVIRLQRHLGARVFISTQEPTISPKLLDLCSVTIVHRFTSPDWLQSLRKHLAGLSTVSKLLRKAVAADQEKNDVSGGEATAASICPITMDGDDITSELFSRIVSLQVGEALLFAPSGIIAVNHDVQKQYQYHPQKLRRLAHQVLRVRVRKRVTADGGRSIMAV